MEIPPRAQAGDGSVARGGAAGVGVRFPVLSQHHTPVLILNMQMREEENTLKIVLYPISSTPAHRGVGPLRQAVGEHSVAMLPLDRGPVPPHVLSRHEPLDVPELVALGIIHKEVGQVGPVGGGLCAQHEGGVGRHGDHAALPVLWVAA